MVWLRLIPECREHSMATLDRDILNGKIKKNGDCRRTGWFALEISLAGMSRPFDRARTKPPAAPTARLIPPG
jgi:hypothetical protein